MKLFPITPQTIPGYDPWRRITVNCQGIKLNSPVHLDGGGLEQKGPFLDLIRKTGKEKYERGFEWCAGLGAIGFEILGAKLVNSMVFSDFYDVAMEDCKDTARINRLHITTFVTPTIAAIPVHEKWDLVVGNPPHAPDGETLREHLMSLTPPTESSLASVENCMRLTVDQNWEIHKEFFENIGNHLLQDADVFLSETETDSKIIEMAQAGGLYLVERHHLPEIRCYIYHFKQDVIGLNYFDHLVYEEVFGREETLVIPARVIVDLQTKRLSVEQLLCRIDQAFSKGKRILVFENKSTAVDEEAMSLANTIFVYVIGRFGLSKENIRYVSACQPDNQHTAAMINHINSKLYVMPSLFSFSVPNDKNTLVKLN